MTKQLVTINLHNPIVQGVGHGSQDTMIIKLGNGEFHGTVDMFITTEQWHALRDKVEGFLRAERAAAEPTDEVYYCDNCDYVSLSPNALAHHVARMHEPYGRKA